MADIKPVDVQPEEEKPRRGRPPGSRNKPKGADTESALAVMSGFYDALNMGLMLLGSPTASMQLADARDRLQESNKASFEASPKLASTIAKIGQGSGVASFFVTNAITLFPIAQIAYRDFSERMNRKNTEEEPQDADTKGFI